MVEWRSCGAAWDCSVVLLDPHSSPMFHIIYCWNLYILWFCCSVSACLSVLGEVIPPPCLELRFLPWFSLLQVVVVSLISGNCPHSDRGSKGRGDVVHCTDYVAHWGDVIMILDCRNKTAIFLLNEPLHLNPRKYCISDALLILNKRDAESLTFLHVQKTLKLVLLPRGVCFQPGPFASRITQKPLNGFPKNLDGGWVTAENRPNYILVRIRIKGQIHATLTVVY